MKRIEYKFEIQIGCIYDYKVVRKEFFSEHLFTKTARYFKTREQAQKYLMKKSNEREIVSNPASTKTPFLLTTSTTASYS